MGISISISISAPLAVEQMRQTMGGGTDVARSVAWVKSNTSSMGLGTTFADEMRGRVAMGETICGEANIAGGKARVEGNSRLSAALANVRMAPDCGSHVAGGEAGVDGNSKTEAMRLGVGKDGGKKRGGENEELHVASAFLPTAGCRAVVPM